METTKVGIIGCGKISGIYFKMMSEVYDIIEVAACADLDMDRAKAKAEEYPTAKPMTVEQLLADPEIEIVVNLTVPGAHADVAMQAVAAGKHVYNEKPLTVTRAEAAELLAAAKAKGVLVGCAPDTFLGGGGQTCRGLIDSGAIGDPIGATAFMMCPGHERWHPDPEFYYEVGGGPMFDMGPYYLTALVNLLGPVKRVTGSTRISFPTRTITSEKKNGKIIDVEVPTHVTGLLEFVSGPIVTIITSFDVQASDLPRIELYGSKATLSVPDPNGFGGTVRVRAAGEKEWTDVELTHEADIQRGTGVADMAYAIRSGRPHRASGELAAHVLDIMHAIHDASDQAKHITLETTCQRPTALPTGLTRGTLDE